MDLKYEFSASSSLHVCRSLRPGRVRLQDEMIFCSLSVLPMRTYLLTKSDNAAAALEGPLNSI